MSGSPSLVLSAPLAEALGYMQRAVACPEDVRARVAALRVPADDVPGVRMNTNWRAGPPSAPRGGGGWNQRGQGQGHHRGGGGGGNWNGPRPAAPRRPYVDRATMPRYGNKGRADVSTDERMMDRIRDKMNKFSPLTYDATKSWLTQLLDSGQTEFLTGFITLVFEKAAREPGLVDSYARLIAELRTAFPHLTVELQRIFAEFLGVFTAATTEPDLGTAAYDAFVALRERQKFRRGYAAFIAATAALGALDIADIVRTATVILDALTAAKVVAENSQLCEEYAECLKPLFGTCRLRDPEVLRLVAVAKEKAPGLSNRARFALMDILEAAAKA